VFELANSSAYFEGNYWGYATMGGGNFEFATYGYVYGAAYTYYYAGYGSY
jgi:hypothetical protein